jgi:SAM-dependent MidA family methyltransferase
VARLQRDATETCGDVTLTARIAADIALTGPISVAEYMMRRLHDPVAGYYATRPALGERGDFVTAPLISQMFGELVGLWLAETWRGLGSPAPVILAEAGPGDGTLMSDILRVARLAPGFAAAAEVWLMETSAPLRALQAERLAPATPRWAAALAELPDDAPLLLVANELLDCLPARQFVRTPRGGWTERVIGLDADGMGLAWGVRPAAPLCVEATAGDVIEVSAAQEAFAAELAARIVAQGGAALLIDYGRAAPDAADTLQAIARHEKVDALAAPDGADFTMHADFPAVLAAARAADASVAMLTQREFLLRLGIETRAATLARSRPDRADTIARQLERLIGQDQMGELFKAAAIWRGPAPPAFEAPE